MAVQSTLDAKLFTILDHRPTASPAFITISLVIINMFIITMIILSFCNCPGLISISVFIFTIIIITGENTLQLVLIFVTAHHHLYCQQISIVNTAPMITIIKETTNQYDVMMSVTILLLMGKNEPFCVRFCFSC